MKKVLIAAAAATLLLGVSSSPAAAEGAFVGNASHSGEVSNVRAHVCDEWIRFSGTVRIVRMGVSWGEHETGFEQWREIDNWIGVGETSGTTYRLVSINSKVERKTDDQMVWATWQQTSKIIGGGQIYTLHIWGHMTLTPSGDVAVSVGDTRVDGCSA